MNRVLLFLVMLPAPLWARLGADVPQLRALLDVRLRLDDRRPLNGLTRPGSEKKKKRFAILLSMIVSLFSGMIYTFAFAVQDPRTGIFFYFSIFLLMLSFLLVSDFSNVLVDTRDKYIVLPQPVDGRTIFLARILHIGAYFLRILLPMSLPGMVVLGMQYGWPAAVWFIVPLMALAATALFLVLGIYLLILRLGTQRRFKEVLSYFQIAFSIFVFGAYYLLPRMVDRSNFLNLSIDDHSWLRFTPPYWLMSLFSWIQPFGARSWAWGILAIVFPLLCMYLTIRILAPRFAAILGELDVSESGSEPVAGRKTAGRKSLPVRLSRLLNRSQDSQAGFLLVWLQTGRSRSFKMRVYPSMATVPILLIAPFVTNGKNPQEVLSHLRDSDMHLLLLYVSTLSLLQTLAALAISEHYKASWIYRASPVQEPGALIAAAYKVVLVKLILPFYVIVAAVVLSIWGAGVIADVLLAVMNVTLYGWVMMRLSFRRLPFSLQSEDTGGGSRFLLGLLGFFIGGLLALAHYLTFDFLVLKVLFMVLSGIAIWLVQDSVQHTPWSAVVDKS